MANDEIERKSYSPAAGGACPAKPRTSAGREEGGIAKFLRRLEEMGIRDEVAVLIRPRGILVEDLISRSRQKNVVAARHEIMYWIRIKMKWSYPEIGKLFERDHTSVMFACRKMLRENPAFGGASTFGGTSLFAFSGASGGTGANSDDVSDWLIR